LKSIKEVIKMVQQWWFEKQDNKEWEHFRQDVLMNGDWKSFEYRGAWCEIERHPTGGYLQGFINTKYSITDWFKCQWNIEKCCDDRIGFYCVGDNHYTPIGGTTGTYKDFKWVENQLKRIIDAIQKN
jgi:hypothetical protein